MKKYDIAVIGAGSAGLTAARLAAKFGVSVVLFEKHRIGGDCLYSGCVPSKSIISVAREVWQAQHLQHYGVKASVKLDFQSVRKHIQDSISHIHNHEDNAQNLTESGIDVVEEPVKFISESTLQSATGEEYEFKKCIVTSGSSPNNLKIKGLKPEHVITSDTIWSLQKLPRHLVIVGGGPIGLELGQAFAMLGSRVTVVERGEKLLGKFDEDVSDSIAQGLKESGVNILLNAEIESVKDETSLKIRIKSGNKSETYTADKVLAAIGRTPHTAGMNLEQANITYDEHKGIKVDDKLRTTNKKVYAAGDCRGGPYFTHLAGEQGATALTHALFSYKRPVNWDALPWAFFTTPEVAHVGANEQELTSANKYFEREVLDYGQIDKAVAEHKTGKITILLNKKRKILGATIIGENASELIGYYAYIMGTGEQLDKLGEPIQAYPTYALAMRKHASDIQVKAFANTIIPKIILKLRGY